MPEYYGPQEGKKSGETVFFGIMGFVWFGFAIVILTELIPEHIVLTDGERLISGLLAIAVSQICFFRSAFHRNVG